MIGSRTNSLLAIILWLAMTASAFAAAPIVSVDAQVDKSDITVGDHIQFSVAVKHETRAKIKIPALVDKLGEFLIRDIKHPPAQQENDLLVDKVTYDLTTYMTGEVSVPAVAIEYTYTDDAGKEVSETINTEPLKIQVHRVAPEDATDIRDIKGPVDIPISWRYYAVWGGIAFVLIAVTALGILYWKKWRPRAVEAARLAPPVPAHEMALERLRHIEEMDLIAEERFKEYYDLVTGVMREYLGARYTLDALEMTTSELMRGLTSSLKDMELRAKIASVLEEGDMVKFAKHVPEKDIATKAIDDARTVIRNTTPTLFLREQAADAASDSRPPEGEGA